MKRLILCAAAAASAVSACRPDIERFDALPAYLCAGESTTLTWSVANADLLRLEYADESRRGMRLERFRDSMEVWPDEDMDFRLRASNSAGPVTDDAGMRLLPPATPTVVLEETQGAGCAQTVRFRAPAGRFSPALRITDAVFSGSLDLALQNRQGPLSGPLAGAIWSVDAVSGDCLVGGGSGLPRGVTLVVTAVCP